MMGHLDYALRLYEGKLRLKEGMIRLGDKKRGLEVMIDLHSA